MNNGGQRRSTGQSQSATFREVLAVAEFRALWLAELQSVAGDMLARVALSILVFQHTGSAAWTALTYALTMLPDLIAGPLLGGLADRYPRRTVMVIADLSRAVLVALMALPGVPLVVLAGLLVLVQLFAAPFAAAQIATLPLALEGDRFDVAQATRQITVQVAQGLGFAAGGALVAWIGVHRSLAIDAATFAVSALLIRAGVVRRPSATATIGADLASDAQGYWRRIAAGARVIWSQPALRIIVGLAWLAGFVVVPEGLAAVYAGQLRLGAAAVGILLAAHPAGLVIGAVLVGRVLSPVWRRRLMAPLAVAALLPLLVFVAEPGLIPAAVLLVLSGACGSYQITASTTFVRLVPDSGRGQAFGLAGSGLIAVQGIGVVGGGALAQALNSAADAIAIAGVVGLVAGLVLATRWRALNKMSTDDGPAGASPGLVA